MYNYPINFGASFTLVHHLMGGANESGDVRCFAIRAVQFRRVKDHSMFGRVGSRLGRKSWETAARVACAETHCLGSNFMHLSFTNVKQSK